MAYKNLKPLITESSHAGDVSQKISHPAYGLISITRPMGGRKEMFGSDLRHDNTVTIRISNAIEERSLGRSWYYEKGQIIELDMTEAQWAKFVSSHGMSGTPVTLRYIREEGQIPWIESQNSKADYSEKEFERVIKNNMQYAQDALNEVKELIAKGKAGKKDLENLEKVLWRIVERFPDSAAFAVKAFKEETEEMVEGAKIEIEASLSALVQNTGIQALGIKNWNKLEDKSDE